MTCLCPKIPERFRKPSPRAPGIGRQRKQTWPRWPHNKLHLNQRFYMVPFRIRLIKKLGQLPAQMMAGVDQALKLHYDLE